MQPRGKNRFKQTGIWNYSGGGSLPAIAGGISAVRVESDHKEHAHDSHRSGWKPDDTAARDGRRYDECRL
jgi:hypothetical protein